MGTAFLSSGSFLHTIMAKSKCWCVDGETIFVLKIRDNNYYRIELPNNSEEDRVAAEELKVTLAKVLQYETTECPFKRGFYVELPERVDVVKKPWTPKHKPITSRGATAEDSDGRESISTGASSDENDAEDTENEKSLQTPRRQAFGVEPESPPPQSDTQPTSPQSPYVETVVSNFESLKVVDRQPSPSRRQQESSLMVGQLPARDSPNERHLAHPIHAQQEHTLPASTPIGGEPRLEEEETHPQQPTLDLVSGEAESQLEKLPPQGSMPEQDLQPQESVPAQELLGIEVSAHNHDAGARKDPVVPPTGEDQDTDVEERLVESARPPSDGIHWLQFEDDEPIPTAMPPFARSFTEPTPSHEVSALNCEEALAAEPSPEFADHQARARDVDTLSIASTVDSFHSSFTPSSTVVSLSGSPEFEDTSILQRENVIYVPKRPAHRHTDSELTVRPASSSEDEPSTQEWLELSPVQEALPDSEKAPYIGSEIPPVVAQAQPSSRHNSPASILRKRLHQRRALSPLPPAHILHIPRNEFVSHHFAIALFQRTFQMLAGPSAQLLALMASITSRIANGALIGNTTYDVNTGRKIPCSWDSDSNGSSEGLDSEDDEFGAPSGTGPVRHRGRGRAGNREEDG